MNFLSFEQLTPDEPGFTRVDTLFVNSKGTAVLKTEWLPSCAQERHVAREPGLCRLCEKAWAHSQGRIMRAHGWFNECLKVTHDDAAILLESGWTLENRTAEFSYLSVPAFEEDVLIPLYDSSELPREVSKSLSLKELPFLRKAESQDIARINRAALNDYKRIAAQFLTLEEHFVFLSQGHRATRPRLAKLDQD